MLIGGTRMLSAPNGDRRRRRRMESPTVTARARPHENNDFARRAEDAGHQCSMPIGRLPRSKARSDVACKFIAHNLLLCSRVRLSHNNASIRNVDVTGRDRRLSEWTVTGIPFGGSPLAPGTPVRSSLCGDPSWESTTAAPASLSCRSRSFPPKNTREARWTGLDGSWFRN